MTAITISPEDCNEITAEPQPASWQSSAGRANPARAGEGISPPQRGSKSGEVQSFPCESPSSREDYR